jgi:hypothetical protein
LIFSLWNIFAVYLFSLGYLLIHCSVPLCQYSACVSSPVNKARKIETFKMTHSICAFFSFFELTKFHSRSWSQWRRKVYTIGERCGKWFMMFSACWDFFFAWKLWTFVLLLFIYMQRHCHFYIERHKFVKPARELFSIFGRNKIFDAMLKEMRMRQWNEMINFPFFFAITTDKLLKTKLAF